MESVLEAIDKSGIEILTFSAKRDKALYNLITDYADQPNPRLVKMAIVALALDIIEDPLGEKVYVKFPLDIEGISQMTGITIGTVVQTLWTKLQIRWDKDGELQKVGFDRKVFA